MMGCCHANKTKVRPRKTALTQTTIQVIQASWAVVSEQKEKFGVFVYNSFLAREKEMRRLFPRLVVGEEGAETFRLDEQEVRRHALLVMDGLGLAVECLHDQNKMSHFLRIVGVRHARAGVQSQQLIKLYPAIDEALKMVMGRDFKHSIHRAWREFFLYIVDSMKTAMDDDHKSSASADAAKDGHTTPTRGPVSTSIAAKPEHGSPPHCPLD